MYEKYLFSLNEVLNDKTMQDMGRMWQIHHDRSPTGRFEHKAIAQSAEAAERAKPSILKFVKKRKELQNQLQNAPDVPFDPNHKYRSGEIKPAGYYQKALNSLTGRITKYEDKFPGVGESYSKLVKRYQGKKLGWEENPGIDIGDNYHKKFYKAFPWKKYASSDDISMGVATMHQRAGERSMAAIGRLTNYLNRNGVNQENPTAQDRANFERFRQRMSGHPLWKNS